LHPAEAEAETGTEAEAEEEWQTELIDEFVETTGGAIDRGAAKVRALKKVCICSRVLDSRYIYVYVHVVRLCLCVCVEM